MEVIFAIIWFLIFIKLFLFWLWLWQLKEYHTGRFLAHFEAQKIKKVFSSLWRLKYPKFTKKIIIIFFTGTLLAILWLFLFSPLLLIILTPIFSSLLVLFFQIPTFFWRNIIIKKAKKKRESFKHLLVVGVTGSYGKTSVKEFLATILAEKFHPVKSREAGISPKTKLFNRVKVLKTKEHQNSEVGVSLCILNDLKPEHEIFVCEMGAYNRGGIKLLCDIAKPKIGIITGVNEQHLATFGTMENIIQTKFELIQAIPEDGLAILNDSDPKIKNEKLKIKNYNSKLKNIRLCSIEEKTDIWAEDIRVGKERIYFKVFSKDGDSVDFKVNLLGRQNVENVLLAVAVAKELGMSLEEIATASEKIESGQSGVQLKKGINGLNLIDATYSANPDGVLAHLEYLKTFPGKKIIIMPCLIELGKASKEVHKRIGRKIGEVCDLAIITTEDRFKEIKEGAGEKALFIENPEEIFKKIKELCRENDVILLESRVPGQLIQRLLL